MVVLCKWRLHIISGGRNIHSKAFRWNSCIKKFTKVKVQALVEELTASGRRRWVAALSLRAGTVQLCGKFEVNNVSWISVSGNWKSRHCLRKWTSCQWRWLPSRKLCYSPDLTPSVCLFPQKWRRSSAVTVLTAMMTWLLLSTTFQHTDFNKEGLRTLHGRMCKCRRSLRW